MTMMTNRRRGLVAAAVVLTVIGVAALATALTRQEPAPPQAPTVSATAQTGPEPATPTNPQPRPPAKTGSKTPAAPDASDPTGPPATVPRAPERKLQGPEADSAPPVSVSIPAIGVTSDLVPLGLNPDRTMQVPTDPAAVGWFTKAPTPGTLGPAVLAGHVTWDQHPAVFYQLATLEPGNTITIERNDGTTAIFTTTGVEQYAKTEFPTEKVYGTIDHAGLRLITCAGPYDTNTGNYNDNIIVYAKLTTIR